MRGTPKVIAAEPKRNFIVHVRFEDGAEGDVDLTYLTKYGGVFEKLRDPDYFRRVRIYPAGQTIFWPNDADIAPETLYTRVCGRAPSAS
jgi:hypothetical protein